MGHDHNGYASLIVNPELSEQMLHCATLNGSWVVRPEWASALHHNTTYQGWAIKYNPATATRRLILRPNKSMQKRPRRLRQLLPGKALGEVSGSLEDWVVRKHMAKDQHNPASVIALVAECRGSKLPTRRPCLQRRALFILILLFYVFSLFFSCCFSSSFFGVCGGTWPRHRRP